MKNLLTIPVDINRKVHLSLILKLCTDDQLGMFERMYPGGINKMKPSMYENAIDQVERTILRLNTDVVRLRDIEKESKQKDEQIVCLNILSHERISDLLNQVADLTAIIDRKNETIKQRNETLKKFDDLTDVLTQGYGAASCINPIIDATNAVAKIRGILADLAITSPASVETQERLDKLYALEAAGVDNWEGYDFAMETLENA